MSRIPPPFFTLSVKAGSTYQTMLGTVVVLKSGKLKTPDAGSSVMVEYTIDGAPGNPVKQYEFKKWLWDNMSDEQKAIAKNNIPLTDQTPPPPPDQTQTPPPPPPPDQTQTPPPPPPPDQTQTPPPPPPGPKKRGMFDWMDDVYDFIFG